MAKKKTLKMFIQGEFESLIDFAAKMDIGPVTMQRWMNGSEAPTVHQMATMSKILGRSPSVLMRAMEIGAVRRFNRRRERVHQKMMDAFPDSFTKVQYDAPPAPGMTRAEEAIKAEKDAVSAARMASNP